MIIGLIFYVSLYIKCGYEDTAGSEKDIEPPRVIRSLSDLETSVNNLYNLLKAFEQKQDTMQKLLEEDVEQRRKAAELVQPPVQKLPEQKEEPQAKIEEKQEAPVKKKSNKLFPDSPLFKEWGGNLSEDEQREAQSLFDKYGYNVFLSDRLPLDRAIADTRDKSYALCLEKTYPKDLPSIGVVLIYLNEGLSILKRALRSIIDRTPKNLLKEIILVDDNSSNEDLKGDLDVYVKSLEQQNPGLRFTRVRHNEQRGLSYARASGWRAATADVVAILDAHIEVHEMWAEPLLTQIKGDRTVSFFSDDYYKLMDGSLPGKSPSVMGILVADRKYLGEIGVLDEGMKMYGGENVELGIRVWTCGGSIEVVPCSRIAHIERAHKPYMPDLSVAMRRNAMRVAEVWMDEYKHNVNLFWNLPFENHGIDIGMSRRGKN
ncbi:hypothetical protein KUCAC02_021255 [Chaenocephalus aceratus]|uniref:Uncharacterized protein n=1 Tax=Chaenocephalus aceratus TaxID=36190 RepID=A0ACB9XGM7_CHAAC|nr:hypothetical protein KUCAC02_021255 [Chaenocephalus aceratus]